LPPGVIPHLPTWTCHGYTAPGFAPVSETVATVVFALVPGSTVAMPAIVPPFMGVSFADIFMPCANATVLNRTATAAMVRRDFM